MSKALSWGWVSSDAMCHAYNRLDTDWQSYRTCKQGIKFYLQHHSTTHEIVQRDDGRWELWAKDGSMKRYPDKDTLMTVLALKGVRVDE